MIYIESSSINPYYNLALEEFAFNDLEDNVFMLWQNDNTIVLGKYQNAIEEVSAKYVKENQVNVVRRLSGGGAVYHDLGNINFTFITRNNWDNYFKFEYFTQTIVEFLKTLNVNVEFNSRNDLIVDGKKFSGNSAYMKNGNTLHHGTILFDSNLETLVLALNVNDAKIESKAIKSVRNRVTNLKEHLEKDLTIEGFKNALIEFVFNKYNGIEQYVLSDEENKKINDRAENYYMTKKWVYGESPDCNVKKFRKHSSGLYSLHMNVERNQIMKMNLYGDFFATEDIGCILEKFVGKDLSEESLFEPVKLLNGRIHGLDENFLMNLIMY